jgi:hypothetical protein
MQVLEKNKLQSFLIKNKSYIILIISLFVLILLSFFGYFFYDSNKKNKNSLLLLDVKQNLSIDNVSEALKILDVLIKDGAAGYQLVASLQKVYIALASGNSQEALDILKNSKEKLSISNYYKNSLNYIYFSLKINLSETNLIDLEKEIKNSLNKKDIFYFNMLELYAMLLVQNNKRSESITFYKEILDAKDVSVAIKERSERIYGLLINE